MMVCGKISTAVLLLVLSSMAVTVFAETGKQIMQATLDSAINV